MPSAPYFDLWLTPNRSLPQSKAKWLIVGFGAVMGLAALRMIALGAWPVAPFLLGDVALVAWAFRASYRSGEASEQVRLDDEALTVRRRAPGGRERGTTLEPFWTRVRLEKLAMRQNRLWLTARGRSLLVGQFLSPGERESIHGVIEDGLARYRERRP